MAVVTATPRRPVLPKRPLPQRAMRILAAVVIGYFALWAAGAGASWAFRTG
ncbi:hypothetical protein AB0L99_17340 [Streptomyces sp. NPDC051954]|uniref:hypothetical protein n=1 Tax=unclassified Streptomyces TaxID=2593676 RepID=UPI00343B3285